MPRLPFLFAAAAAWAGPPLAAPAYGQAGPSLPALPAPPADPGGAPGTDDPDLAAPALPEPEPDFGGAPGPGPVPPADPDGFEPVPSRNGLSSRDAAPRTAPVEGPAVGPDRAREGGVDARRFDPAPADATRDAPRDDRRRDPAGPPAPGDNGYGYAPQSLPPGGAVTPNLNPGTQDPGLVPGGYYDPDRSPVLLGVSGRDTTEGVLITGVLPGTPAQAAGLEAGDRVLTVGGYQVGVVVTPAGPRVYPLGRELARRLGPTGEVTLLVQDGRSGRITNVVARPVPRTGPTDALDPAGGSYGPPVYGPTDPYGGGFGTGLGNGVGGGLGGGLSIEAGPFGGRFGRRRRSVQYRGTLRP